MKEWENYATEYVREFLRLEGLAGSAGNQRCPMCEDTSAEAKPADHNFNNAKETEAKDKLYVPIKCDDCMRYRPRCADCILRDHQTNPLHRLKVMKPKINRNNF